MIVSVLVVVAGRCALPPMMDRRSGRHARGLQLLRNNLWRPDPEATGASAPRSEIWVPVEGPHPAPMSELGAQIFSVAPIARCGACFTAHSPSGRSGSLRFTIAHSLWSARDQQLGAVRSDS